MGAVRALVLLILLMATVLPAAAQDALGEPGSIDPVAAAIAADHQTKCDEIGWGILPEHLDGGTLIASFQHYGVCHLGVGSAFFGGCVIPFRHEDLPDILQPGEAEVICTVSVQALEDFGAVVNPADFYIIDYMDRSYGTKPETYDFDRALKYTELQQNEIAGGRLYFRVDDPLYIPFLLVWFPSIPPDQRLAAIIIDEMVPWEDTAGF